MSAPAQTSANTDETDPADAWERALLDRQLEALGRLADMGMAIAAAIERRVTAEDPEPAPVQHHAAIDFARVSRAVRLTFALQSKLIADFKAPARPAKAAAEEAEEPFDTLDVMWLGGREANEPMRRADVQRSICRAGEAAGLDREAVERLRLEAAERLERDGIAAIRNSVPAAGMRQLFFSDPDGVRIEVNVLERDGAVARDA